MHIADWVTGWPTSPFNHSDMAPWEVTSLAEALIVGAIQQLDGGYEVSGGVARHVSATVEPGAILKPPVIIGPSALVAAGAYLRGGVFLDHGCIVGPHCELKSSFLFANAKVAHLSFVGDSIVGARANIEAGAIIANYRNEMEDKRIRILHAGVVIDTGADKFGALIGDDVKIGANAVIAPGALIGRGTRIARLASVDQHPERQDE